MRTFFTAAAATALMATSAFAQQATQTGVVGPSGVATYTVQVTASNGQTYNCLPDIQNIAGVPTRQCVNANPVGGLGNAGAGIAGGAGAAIAGLVVLAVAAGGSSSTTTTN